MSIDHLQYFVLVFLLAVGLLGAGQAAARFDHNEIRRLYRSGTILSLDAIIAKHRHRYPGRAIWWRGRFGYRLER